METQNITVYPAFLARFQSNLRGMETLAKLLLSVQEYFVSIESKRNGNDKITEINRLLWQVSIESKRNGNIGAMVVSFLLLIVSIESKRNGNSSPSLQE